MTPPRRIAPPPVYFPHAKPAASAQPHPAPAPAVSRTAPPPVRWPGQGTPIRAHPTPLVQQAPSPIQPQRLTPPPVPSPRPPRTVPVPPPAVQRQTPAVRPGWPNRGTIQAVLSGRAVKGIVTYIKAQGAALGTLTYDDATPDNKQLEENYTVIGKGIEGVGESYKVSPEHVEQVAKALGKAPKTVSVRDPAPPAPAVVAVEIPHLDTFDNEATKLASHDPADSSLRARIDGGAVAEAKTILEVQAALLKPDESSEVTTTQGDGEVQPLIDTLSNFVGYLSKKANQQSQHHFTVALVGPYGPCNGCKKRIAKFVELWGKAATRLMKEGVTAKLTVTYKYQNEPQAARSQYYGYEEDSTQRAPYRHTLIKEIVGTKKD